jgi:hypothetical protein
VDFAGARPLTFDDRWHHVWISFDVANPKRASIEIDNVAAPARVIPPTERDDVLIDYTNNDTWNVGGEAIGGTDYYIGDMAEFYFRPYAGAFLPASRIIGVALSTTMGSTLVGGVGWRTNNNEAMEIGPDGSLAWANTKPLIYLSGYKQRFPRNGGASRTSPQTFQETGQLVDTFSSPLDPFPVP